MQNISPNTCNYVTVYRCRNQQNHSLNLHRRGNPRSYMLNRYARQKFTGSLNTLFREREALCSFETL